MGGAQLRLGGREREMGRQSQDMMYIRRLDVELDAVLGTELIQHKLREQTLTLKIQSCKAIGGYREVHKMR